MKFIQQPTRFEVNPLGEKEKEEEASHHGPLLPNSIRCLICGPSNCGKTNLMISLLFHPKTLRFRHVYVYSKSLHQPKYRFAKSVLEKAGVKTHFMSNEDQVLPPDRTQPESIIIFDDVACENQDILRAFFSMGRHAQVDSFYLCQSYSKIPKQLIRDNANLLMLFKQDNINLRHVFDEHVYPDMSWGEFQRFCQAGWKTNKYGFIVVALDYPLEEGRYRRGLDEFWRKK